MKVEPQKQAIFTSAGSEWNDHRMLRPFLSVLYILCLDVSFNAIIVGLYIRLREMSRISN